MTIFNPTPKLIVLSDNVSNLSLATITSSSTTEQLTRPTNISYLAKTEVALFMILFHFVLVFAIARAVKILNSKPSNIKPN